MLPREEVVRLLTKEGDFLVRETTRNDENQTVLSVCWGGHKHFIVQTTSDVSVRCSSHTNDNDNMVQGHPLDGESWVIPSPSFF